MITFKTPPTMFDVDDTLIMWQDTHPEAVEMTIGAYTERVVIHHEHIKALKLHKFRGHTIVVWSAGGAEWAEKVVIALGLEAWVDVCMDKPAWYYDDIPAKEYMPESLRIYIEKYKGRNVGHGPVAGTADAVGPTIYATADSDFKEGDPMVIQGNRAYKI